MISLIMHSKRREEQVSPSGGHDWRGLYGTRADESDRAQHSRYAHGRCVQPASKRKRATSSDTRVLRTSVVATTQGQLEDALLGGRPW